MDSLLPSHVDLSPAAARTLAIAMRDVAHADGAHPQEEALIAHFAEGLDLDETGDLAAIDTPRLQELFLETLWLVAFADGGISDEEETVIRGYADQLSVGDKELHHCRTEVAKTLLSQLSGVQATRDQVIALGEKMGLDRFTIEHVLAGDAD